jgi:hypothetical protein
MVIASAEEMTHYLVAHLNGGRYQETQVLSPSSLAEMHQPRIMLPEGTAQGQGYTDPGYGLGWFTGIRNGVEVVGHSGDLPLYHADMVLVPGEQWGIILLMNANNRLTGERMRGIVDGVTALLLEREPPAVETGGSGFLLIFRIVLGLALLQLGIIAWSLATFKRWSAALQRRPRSWWAVVWHLVLPLILQLLLGLIFLLGLPLISGSSLLLMAESTPDLGYVAIASGFIGLGWAMIRAGLAYKILRAPAKAKTVHRLLPV